MDRTPTQQEIYPFDDVVIEDLWLPNTTGL